MNLTAQTKSIQVSPRKMRLVADSVRGLSIERAFAVLATSPKRASNIIEKTLQSAIANAVNNAKLAKETLVVDRIEVTEGQSLKRFHPSTRGRVHPYKRRRSHLRVVLIEKGETNGTKS